MGEVWAAAWKPAAMEVIPKVRKAIFTQCMMQGRAPAELRDMNKWDERYKAHDTVYGVKPNVFWASRMALARRQCVPALRWRGAQRRVGGRARLGRTPST